MKEMIIEVKIDTEYLQLQQLLKMVDLIDSGGQAKMFLEQNEVLVDGEAENRRGRKLYPGSLVKVFDKTYKVIK